MMHSPFPACRAANPSRAFLAFPSAIPGYTVDRGRSACDSCLAHGRAVIRARCLIGFFAARLPVFSAYFLDLTEDRPADWQGRPFPLSSEMFSFPGVPGDAIGTRLPSVPSSPPPDFQALSGRGFNACRAWRVGLRSRLARNVPATATAAASRRVPGVSPRRRT